LKPISPKQKCGKIKIKDGSLAKQIMKSKFKKPDYGIDAPAIMRNIVIMAIASIAVGEYLLTFKNQSADLFANILFVIARINIIHIILGILYVRIGKLNIATEC